MSIRDLLIAATSKKTPIVATAFTQNAAAGNTLVINKPAGTLEGDVMVALVSVGGSTAGYSWSGIPTGWASAGTIGNYLMLATATAGASEPASYTFTFSTSLVKLAGAIITLRGVAESDIVKYWADSTSTTVTIGTTNDPGFKPFLIAGYSMQAASRTWTVPTGMERLLEDADANAPSMSLFMQDATLPLGSFASTHSGIASGTAGGWLLAINANGVALSSYSGTSAAATSYATVSETLTVTSFVGAVAVTVPAGVTFSVNGGAYVSSGTVSNGDTIKFKATSSASPNTIDQYTMSFGGKVDYVWSVDTANYKIYHSTFVTQNFVVPQGVTAISMLAAGSGGLGPKGTSTDTYMAGGGGGGVSYSNSVSVTPSESLTVFAANSNAQASYIKRNTTDLVLANGGGNASLNVAGAGASTTGAVGTVKYGGGTGATGATGVYGGGGGNSASPAGAGSNGTRQTTVNYGGNGGTGVTYGSTGWSTSGPNNATGVKGAVGANASGGAGGGVYAGGTGGAGVYSDGGYGSVVLIWGGRTFSSGSSY